MLRSKLRLSDPESISDSSNAPVDDTLSDNNETDFDSIRSYHLRIVNLLRTTDIRIFDPLEKQKENDNLDRAYRSLCVVPENQLLIF